MGRGASLAAVGTGALIIKESDHFHAEGMSSAGFRHGPLEMLSDEIFVLVFAGDEPTRDLNERLVEDIRQQSGRTELVGEGVGFAACKLAAAHRSFHPILEILPVQMITLALAAQVGREPGRFELARRLLPENSWRTRRMPRNRYLVSIVFLTFFVMSLLTNILGPIVPDIISTFKVSLTAAALLPFSSMIGL